MLPNPGDNKKRPFSHSGLSEKKQDLKRVDARERSHFKARRELNTFDSEEELAWPLLDNTSPTTTPNISYILRPSLLSSVVTQPKATTTDINTVISSVESTNMAEAGQAKLPQLGVIVKMSLGSCFLPR